jgi:hypothetical protein
LPDRAPPDPPSARDEVSRSRILDHIERVLVTHIDDRRADFDATCLRANGRQERERGRELSREVVNAEVGPICAQRLGSDG